MKDSNKQLQQWPLHSEVSGKNTGHSLQSYDFPLRFTTTECTVQQWFCFKFIGSLLNTTNASIVLIVALTSYNHRFL